MSEDQPMIERRIVLTDDPQRPFDVVYVVTEEAQADRG